MNRKAQIATAVLLGSLTAAGIFYACRPGKAPGAVYQTVPVVRGNIRTTVTATGTVEPITQVEVGTQVSGTISKIYADYNSQVTTGQLLAELDRTVLESELKSSRANLAGSRNEYEYEEKNYRRIKGLYEKKLVSDTEYETAEYQYVKAMNAYEKAQADMVKAETNLNYARIYSPIDGVVLSRAVDEGQTVAASFNTPTLFTIANDLKKMQVIADVDEADIGQVKEGQSVTFTVDAFPEDVFAGNVMQVRLQPTTTSNVVTYEVVIDAPNPELKLMPGLTANITVCTAEANDALLVPVKSFRYRPSEASVPQAETADQSDRTLWVEREGRAVAVSVTAGITDGIHMQVAGDLAEGDPIIVGVQQGKTSQKGPESEGENNPFMPARPGGDRKK